MDTSPLLQRFCNTTTPAPLTTTGPTAWLKFHSDSSYSDQGFHITYASVSGTVSFLSNKCWKLTFLAGSKYCQSISPFFNKNNGVFDILIFKILMKRLLTMFLVLNIRAQVGNCLATLIFPPCSVRDYCFKKNVDRWQHCLTPAADALNHSSVLPFNVSWG